MPEFNIPLNASNYVSEERKKAFQKALEEGQQANVQEKEQNQAKAERGSELKTPSSYPSDEVCQQPVPANQAGPSLSLDKLVDSIGQGLAHSFNHQNRTLEVHQEYLSHQNEYGKMFSEILDQQRLLLEKERGEPAQKILDTIQKIVEGFQDIQEKGLEVHRQFLDQQAAYAKAYVDLLQQQHQTLTNSNGQPSPKIVPSHAAKSAFPEWTEQTGDREDVDSRTALDGFKGKAQEGIPKVDRVKKSEEAQIQPAPDQDKTTVTVKVEELSDTLLEIVGEKTGYPPDMLELDMDMEADLGIDSIKRVEILGALEDTYPSLPQADTSTLAELRTLGEIVKYMRTMTSPDDSAAETSKSMEPNPPASSQPDPTNVEREEGSGSPEVEKSDNGKPALDVDTLSHMLLEVVGEKTGYPPEMLELDMDMEADLGIDSIKRVEILGAMEDQVEDLPPFETDTLAELRTLGQVVEYISEVKKEGREEKKKVPHSPIQVHSVTLSPLPPPDRIEHEIPPGRPLLIGDAGSELTSEVARTLNEEGWSVVLWRYSTFRAVSKSDTSGSFPHIQGQHPTDKDIKKQMEIVREQYGKVAGYIHIHPPKNNLKDPEERQLIKEVFFLGKHLKDDLATSPDRGRTFFITVTQYDGQLGLNRRAPYPTAPASSPTSRRRAPGPYP
ncbi:MAG: phosphopantetheine-binding protein [Anaerolineales bacterium]